VSVFGQELWWAGWPIVITFLSLPQEPEEGAVVSFHNFHGLLCNLTWQEFVGFTVFDQVIGFNERQERAV